MEDLVALASQIIDDGAPIFPVRISQELSEIADDVSLVESFSNVVAVKTRDGLFLSDTSGAMTGAAVVESLRRWSAEPFHTILYTHGHVDHVGGGRAFAKNAEELGHAAPRFVGHVNLPARFDRYEMTNGYNAAINKRQFGDIANMGIGGEWRFLPAGTPRPDVLFDDRLELQVGDVSMELRHARGETDDHTWAWFPDRRMICCGDFFIWNFPNAGNPQKVQRYPREWAAALREMSSLEASLLVPAHGLPIGGVERIRRVLDDTASALETLVNGTLEMMNAGERLDSILHSLKLPADLMDRPYLRPLYDEPEFIIHNIWRLYGGWYDGNPAHLKPAPEAALAREVAALAGGVEALVARARELAAAADFRLACHLVEMAVGAAPDDAGAHGARAEIYAERRKRESSLMAKGIYGDAARESEARR
jgi:alkyl sulfatase BDS1-like metallo-beta-lactamase superfamily hydrolase